MRGHGPVLLLVLLFGAVACAEQDSGLDESNLLVLRLGAGHPSLAAALRRPPPGMESRTRTPARTSAAPDDARPPARTPHSTTPPSTTPPVTRPPATTTPAARSSRDPAAGPSFRVVTLRAGQTLYGLCRSHLGNGGRWKEVAALNGWTEAQAGSLRAGQSVRLPMR